MKDGEAPDKFGEMSLNLARHNLVVTLKRTKEKCFQAAQKMALESAEGARKIDPFVRSQYCDDPRAMAEWDEIMQKYEFVDEEIGEEE